MRFASRVFVRLLRSRARTPRTHRISPPKTSLVPQTHPTWQAKLARISTIESDTGLLPAQRSVALIKVHQDLLQPGEYDPDFWASVSSLSKMNDLELADVEPLLSDLQVSFGHIKGKRQINDAAWAIGDLAYNVSALDVLAPYVRERYMQLLARSNPFRAIELWNNSGKRSLLQGVVFHMMAGNLEKAEALVMSSEHDIPPSWLIKRFITAYAKSGDSVSVRRWTDKLQSPEPRDLLWLQHIMTSYGMDHIFPEYGVGASGGSDKNRTLSDSQKRLVSVISRLISDHPAAFDEPALMDTWYKLMDFGDPATATELMRQLLTLQLVDSSELMPALKILPADAAVNLVLDLDSAGAYQAPESWLVAVKRVKTTKRSNSERSELAAILSERMRYWKILMNPEALAAVFSSNPSNIVGLAMEAINAGVGLRAHHLRPVWALLNRESSEDTPLDGNVVHVLWTVSRTFEPDLVLFRSAMYAFVRARDLVGAAAALYDYVVERRVKLDPRVVAGAANLLATGAADTRRLAAPLANHAELEDRKVEWAALVESLLEHAPSTLYPEPPDILIPRVSSQAVELARRWNATAASK